MDDFIRCKACGFISAQGKIKDVCPACGVPAKMFEAYKHPVSLKRRRLLDLHTHPVAVHFPQAFCLTLALLSLALIVAPERIRHDLYSTLLVLSVLLPFFVVVSIVTGLVDGKLRFRKVTTPFLKKKMVLGALLLIISIALPVLAILGPLSAPAIQIAFLILALFASLCGALLGLIGGQLLDAKFPG